MVFHQKYLQNGTSIHFHGIRNQGPADSDYVNVLKNVTARTNDFDTFVPKPENSLINGMHPFNCALDVFGGICEPNASVARFTFKRGRTYRLRLVNVGAVAFVNFSIAGHKMQTVSNNLVLLKPYEVDFVSLSIGQRVGVLVSVRESPAM
ncbi:multicopper oxidase [Venturia nashicola]|uniref:Multicopper oxidase n=1 Tax=Venturia nashicola TaxID=86259 RepID=A0A4Z1P4C1_9PEZI|nr:multicopper oxidase [Venturia nashicola]